MGDHFMIFLWTYWVIIENPRSWRFIIWYFCVIWLIREEHHWGFDLVDFMWNGPSMVYFTWGNCFNQCTLTSWSCFIHNGLASPPTERSLIPGLYANSSSSPLIFSNLFNASWPKIKHLLHVVSSAVPYSPRIPKLFLRCVWNEISVVVSVERKPP